MTWSRWRIAGLLFIIGGALTLLGSLLAVAGSSAVGGWAGLIGSLLEGVAFILFGLGFHRSRSRAWVPWLYVIAGVLILVTALLSLVGGSLGAAALVVQLGIAALILVASVLLLSAGGAERTLCIALIVLGAVLVINVFVGNVVLTVITGVIYVLIGILLWGVRLSGRRR
jgi:hypothetical protein